MKVSFISKVPHNTLCVNITFPFSEKEPTELLDKLKGKGWKECTQRIPKGFGENQELNLLKQGSDIFGSWTKKEKKEFTKEANDILKEFGFENVPHYKAQFQ